MLRVAALVLLAVALGGCATQGETCSGWTRSPNPNDPMRMAQQERQLSEWIVSHNEYGAKVGCW